MRLIPPQSGKVVSGEIFLKGKKISELSDRQYRKIRGKEISMIFQEPMSSLNPVMKIGKQMIEVLMEHSDLNREEAFSKSVQMLKRTGISDAEKRMESYPFEFSGGMRQRVMIAMALLCEPSILIADEPTTALDVTIQKEILILLKEIKDSRKESGLILITHNLGIVFDMCDRVIVMYGGKVQEEAPSEEIFSEPLHPYTMGLMKSLPNPYSKSEKKLYSINGNVPSPVDMPVGCKFRTRCAKAFEKCKYEPPLKDVGNGHYVRCWLY
jgi:peptide/nickel transport system ATP-binding protein